MFIVHANNSRLHFNQDHFSGCEGVKCDEDGSKKATEDETLNNHGDNSPSVMEETSNESYMQVRII